MASVPLYKSVYLDLKQAIKDGQYPTGTMIPPENDLCIIYSASRTTVRKALSMLHDDGYIQIKQGKGTEVLNQSTTQRLSNISSITETLKAKGYDVSVSSMCIQRIPCPPSLTEILMLQKESDAFRVERIVCADKRPVAYIINYVDARLAPNLDQYSGQFVSLYHFLEKKYNIQLTDADETISATTCSFTDSQLLQLAVGSPLLQSMRITYSGERPVERSESKLVADRYEYRVHLQGR